MWKLYTVLGCLVLTVFAIHTAAQIEVANILTDHYLPRSPAFANSSYTVPDLKQVLDNVDDKIATRRSNAYATINPEKVLPPDEMFLGKPYSENEQRFIDSQIQSHKFHTRLHWWVTRFGSLQYFVAPLAFLWAITNFLVVPKATARVASSLCAVLAFVSIFLMVFRGY